MICYETEMEAQREDKERTNTSSREIETEENDSEKTNQSEIKDEKTCYACGKIVKVNSIFLLHLKKI